MKKIIQIILLTIVIPTFAQQVGIGTNIPDASAKLEIKDTTKGLLIPRMTSTQRDLINSPATGLLIFDNTKNSFWFYDGNQWVSLSSENSSWGEAISAPKKPDQEVVASNSATSDYFGYSVSINGDYAVIGAYSKTVGGNNAQGTAYIFKRTGTSWAEEAILTASNGASGDNFGYSVSIDGDYAVIGAYSKTVGGNSGQGTAYIFKRTGIFWAEEAILTASNGAAYDFFGTSVSINGDYTVIGAYSKTVGGNSGQGTAYIFKRTGTSWAEEAILTASNGAANDKFGISVSLNGDYAVIGAYRGNSNQGTAYIFKRTGTSWVEEAILTASNGAAFDNFGYSVFIDGDYAVIGANTKTVGGNSNQGTAYIFKRTGTSWVKNAIIIDESGGFAESFGISVSISNNNILIGAFGKNMAFFMSKN